MDHKDKSRVYETGGWVELATDPILSLSSPFFFPFFFWVVAVDVIERGPPKGPLYC